MLKIKSSSNKLTDRTTLCNGLALSKVINKSYFYTNRRLQLGENKLLASLDLINLNKHDSILFETHQKESSSLLALNLFATSINERKMIESDSFNSSRIKNIKNNLFQINKSKFNSSNNLKLNNSNVIESKKTRPQSQDGIIEECKNSLDELIKASKWTTTANNGCPKEEKLEELPLASLSLSITATDVFNRSSTSSSSSLECVGNLSSFTEPKLDEDEDINNNKIKNDTQLSSPPQSQNREIYNDFNSSKPPISKSMLPRSYKNVYNSGPSFSPKLLQANNSLINKSTSFNSNLNQKSNFPSMSMIETQNLNDQSNNCGRLAQPEYVDLDSDLEKENEKQENFQKTNVTSGFVQFRNNYNKHANAIDYRSHFNTNLNGIKNLSLSNLSQTNGNYSILDF